MIFRPRKIIFGLQQTAQWCGGCNEVRIELFALVGPSHKPTEVGAVGRDGKLLNGSYLLVIHRATLTVQDEAAVVDFGFRKDKLGRAEGDAVRAYTNLHLPNSGDKLRKTGIVQHACMDASFDHIDHFRKVVDDFAEVVNVVERCVHAAVKLITSRHETLGLGKHR